MNITKQHGFSLLEILVAFSILAVSLSILLNIFAKGVTTAGMAEEYTAAVQIAESLMAKTGVEKPLQIGVTSGVVGQKYYWQVSVQPTQPTLEAVDMTMMTTVLFKVSVIVSWGEQLHPRQVKLVTLKLANKPL